MTATGTVADSLMRNKDIKLAFSVAVFAEWDENDSYREAEQPARIGRALVDAIHKHLANAKIGYLFREKMAEHDKTKLAKASKVGAKLAFYTDLDFLIEVNHEAWMTLSQEQRVALIDHELCHFGVEDDTKGDTRHLLLSHDVEEFEAIVKRWGFWKPDLTKFGVVVGEQLDLLQAAQQS
jgi:hypothetical protein